MTTQKQAETAYKIFLSQDANNIAVEKITLFLESTYNLSPKEAQTDAIKLVMSFIKLKES